LTNTPKPIVTLPKAVKKAPKKANMAKKDAKKDEKAGRSLYGGYWDKKYYWKVSYVTWWSAWLYHGLNSEKCFRRTYTRTIGGRSKTM